MSLSYSVHSVDAKAVNVLVRRFISHRLQLNTSFCYIYMCPAISLVPHHPQIKQAG